MNNALSVDVEDWFQVGAFETVIARDSWETLPRRVERNTDRVLGLFDEAGVKATFFTLGWVAERHPALIRRIADAGHEIASHGWDHRRVFAMNEAEFRADLEPRPQGDRGCGRAIAVTGYRAPSFSIDQRTPWAHPVLAEQGYAYSSSVAPIAHDHYGWRESPRFAWRPVAGSDLIELPVTTVELAGRRFAAGGGGFFRLLPYALLELGDRARQQQRGAPRNLLFPPLGDRSRAAARRRGIGPVEAQALYQFGSDGGQAPEIASRPPMGPHRRRRRRRADAPAMNALAPVSSLIVRTAGLADPRLEAYVRAHAGATFFHLPQWSGAVERGCGQRAHYLLAEQGGAVRGVMPLTEIRSRLFGNALVSAGFGTGGGALADDANAAQALAAAAWDRAQSLGCGSAELRGGAVPAGWQASEGVYAAFARDLPETGDALLESIPRRQRAEVRRALGFALESSAGTDRRHRDAHYRVYCESVRNLGTPVFPRSLFEAALDAFGDDADIVVIWKDGRPLASLLNFYFRGVCQPYWGGGTRAARQWRANDLVYYEVMRRAILRGCTRADFGRSKLGTGPHARKRIWGFEEVPLVYAVRGEAREVNPLSPKYRLRVAAWQRLPLWLANRLGPKIARGLG